MGNKHPYLPVLSKFYSYPAFPVSSRLGLVLKQATVFLFYNCLYCHEFIIFLVNLDRNLLYFVATFLTWTLISIQNTFYNLVDKSLYFWIRISNCCKATFNFCNAYVYKSHKTKATNNLSLIKNVIRSCFQDFSNSINQIVALSHILCVSRDLISHVLCSTCVEVGLFG